MYRILSLVGVLVCCNLVASQTPRFDLQCTNGSRLTSASCKKARAVVLVFLGTDCPISNRYSPRLHKLEQEFVPRGIVFYGVFSDPASTVSAARTYLREFSLDMAGVVDPTASLARETGARVTPEAVVLSPKTEVLYRGRIDNQYVDWGKTRSAPTENNLRDALKQILAYTPVTHAHTTALGCAITGAASDDPAQ